MLNQLVARPMSLRFGSSRLGLLGRAFSRLGPSRDFSQAAALAESTGDSGAEKGCSLSREERVSRMEAFARKHFTEEGALPTPYVLVKEFGGGRNTALKVLSRLEEDMKSSDSSSQSTDASDPVPSATLETPVPVSPSNLSAGEVDSSKMETEPAVASETNKAKDGSFPASHLWARLHSISQKSKPAVSNPNPSKSSSIVLSSESSSEDDEESEVSALDFSEPSMEKNPAQALLQSDLHPRHGLFVKFLDLEATEGDLRAVFKACGEIRRVQINKPRSSTSKYTYAFVDFAMEDGLKKALEREYVIRGVKVQTEPSKRSAESKSPSDTAKVTKVADGKAVQSVKPSECKPFVDNKPQVSKEVNPPQTAKTELLVTEASQGSGYTVSIESIPQSSLPQIVDALSQYGEITSSRTKQYNGGNTTAYIEFKNEQDKDNALAAHHVHLGGKQLKLHRNDPPLTTVVRLSNIPVDSYQKVAMSYKSYGQVDRVEQKMEGIVDIYYNANELKHMTRILDKCNAITVNKRKLRAVPAPVCYPKESLETSAGLKWVESQKSQVLTNLETSLRRAAVYVQDLRGLLSIEPVQRLETAATTTTTTTTTSSDD